MHLVPELEDVVTELCQAHPWFPRVTIARLVGRTVDDVRRSFPDRSVHALAPVVRHATDSQLSYIDDQPDQPIHRRCPGRQRRPAER